jgi:hypothetical protein
MKAKLWCDARFLSRIIAGSIFLWAASPALADTPKVLQIEEQWELSIGVPDAGRSAPQATMVMSPTGNLDSTYFLFTLNSRNLPSYQPGGVQVQRWEGGDSVANSGTGSVAEPLSQSEDTVSWTQRVTLHEGSITFEVTDGSCNSWGHFGNDGSLKLTSETSLDRLNGYKPAVSLGESQIGYADNRVHSLTLKKLVWLTDDGQTHQLSAPIDIHAGLDPDSE